MDGDNVSIQRPDRALKPPSPQRLGFTEAQRTNLTRLIKGSRFSVVGSEIAGQKATGKPVG